MPFFIYYVFTKLEKITAIIKKTSTTIYSASNLRLTISTYLSISHHTRENKHFTRYMLFGLATKIMAFLREVIQSQPILLNGHSGSDQN